MTTIQINASRKYEVTVGDGVLRRAGELSRRSAGGTRVMLVSDSNVAPLYAKAVSTSFTEAGYAVSSFVFPAGEESKSGATLLALLEAAAEAELTRSDIFAALGGGVTGDLCGLAASLYMRGVGFVQIPTTLLAAVDSSVGGKTAVDLSAGKNLCGTFWQPSCVICDPDCLATLPEHIYADGMAEVIKYGIICDRGLFDTVSGGRARGIIEPIISRCVTIKAEIVAEDEYDRGKRALLNLGHTFGHAIEKLSGFGISHGSAVAAGMCIAAQASEKLGFAPDGTAEAVRQAVRANGLSPDCAYSGQQIAQAALTDKKRGGDAISLVLLRRVGECFIHEVPIGELAGIAQSGTVS